jgi:hypothetical protein
MKLRNRFMLVTLGVVVFVVATPILVFYARGYEIDWHNKQFVKTGTFVIKTLPTKADIYLNNKKLKGQAPQNVRFLLPGEYDVRIEKDGYQSWTKRLAIHPQFATWINLDRSFITLFLVSAEQQQAKLVTFSDLSSDGGEIAYIQDDKLNLYNVENENVDTLGDATNFQFPYTFTHNTTWTNGHKTYNLFSNPAKNLELDPKNIKSIQTNGSDMVLLVSDQLVTVVDQKPVNIGQGVSASMIDGENVWYTQGTALKQYNLRTNQTTSSTITLPPYTTSQIVRGEGHTFLILDKSLYVLNDTLEKIYDGVDTANYDVTSHLLLFANPNEILTYDPSNKNTQMVLRSISKISNPVINSYTGYIFFINENKIKAIELDGRDHRNVYNIVDLTSGDSKFALSNDGVRLSVFNDSSLASYKIR